jgi:hypothetical protein
MITDCCAHGPQIDACFTCRHLCSDIRYISQQSTVSLPRTNVSVLICPGNPIWHQYHGCVQYPDVSRRRDILTHQSDLYHRRGRMDTSGNTYISVHSPHRHILTTERNWKWGDGHMNCSVSRIHSRSLTTLVSLLVELDIFRLLPDCSYRLPLPLPIPPHVP